MNTLPLIILSVFINAAAQLLLKEGASYLGSTVLTWQSFFTLLSKAFLNPYILSGLTCYVLSVGIWLIVLSRVDVSYAYPFTSLGYIITAAIGYLLWHEPVTMLRMLGIFIIMLGVFLVARS